MSDSMLTSVFGRFAWTPPPWMARLGLRRWIALLAAIVFIALLAVFLARYYEGLPKPPTLEPVVTAPGLSSFTDDALSPMPLLVAFDVKTDPDVPAEPITSVAALDALSREYLEDVVLEPALAGVWRWQDERTLKFTPEVDWPAGQRFEVRYRRSLFAPNLELGKGEVSFETPAFVATVDALEFNQNPAVPDDRKVVASLSFSHPVGADALREHVAMQRRAAGDTVSNTPTDVGINVFMGPHGRTAFVHSETLALPEAEVYLGLAVDDALAPVAGKGGLDEPLTARVRIPDRASYFRVDDVRGQLVRDEQDDPVQTVSLAFTDRVTVSALNTRLSVYRLPANPRIDGRVERNKYWRSPREVTPQVLGQAERVNATLNPVEGDASRLHSLRLNQPDGAVLYVKIDAGLESTGDFVMGADFDALARLPKYPKEATLAREGGLLPLTGTHRLTLIGRGVQALRVDVRRVVDDALHHLVSQTQGDIKSPAFRNWAFDEDNLTDRVTRFVNVNMAHPARATYSQFDMSEFLPDGGVYLVNVQGWDPARKRPVGRADQRLVLITDMGVLAKRSADGRQDVFVHRLSTGAPLGGARVLLLGKNGLPVLERSTDGQGHLATESLDGLTRERTPVVWLVQDGRDSVFLPYQRYDRQLQYSRFDVGGNYSSAGDGADVRAFMFTDRGLYRPGETVRLAAVVKRDDWGALGALPVGIRVVDPRGNTVHEHRERLASDGLFDRAFATEPASATGRYYASLFVIDAANRETHLGDVSFSVEEFQPDRLRMTARVEGAAPRGWVKPDALSLAVQLDTLFGAPAQDRRIAGTLSLVPSGIRLAAFPDYRFDDPLRRPDAPLTRVDTPLPDARTDKTGRATVPLDLSRYGGGIYRLNIDVEGFEEGEGRSVRSRTSLMMSPLDVLVGYRSDSDLSFLNRDTAHSVVFVAVDPSGESTALSNITQRLMTYRYVSTLVQRPNGTYAYQSVRKESLVEEQPVALPEGGTSLVLPTADPGQYALKLIDADQRVLASVDFTVAGARNVAGNLERDAELDLVLSADSFAAGDEIELQITAPYAGTGLITIERDRVYAHRWFTTDTTTSVQRIRVPEGIEGNAYVNVAFVRDLASPEVFVSPLSYAVAPFAINRAARTIDVRLQAPELGRPGEPLALTYSTDKPARLLLFAVDEGILQRAGYATPKPLDFFLRKLALEVNTYQMVDMILPEFEAWSRRSAPGGGLGADLAQGNLNPFRRRDEAPVAFWSGVLSSGPEAQTVSWSPPDYFNGQLRVMAIAVNDAAAGHGQTKAVVRGPFVLTPNVLTAAAPGDVFDVTVGVANQLDGSGKALPIDVAVSTSEHLTVDGEPGATIQVDEGSEGRVRVRVRALDALGPAELTITAQSGETRVSRKVSLSVRPAVAYTGTVQSGVASGDSVDVSLPRTLRPEFAQQRVAASASPLILVDGLLSYLDVFPHDCAEQMTSKVFPQVGLLGHPGLGTDEAAVREAFAKLLRKLRARQLPDGGFQFWLGASESAGFPSVYIHHFLADAAERGLPVPPAMRSAGINFLREQATRDVGSLSEARVRAYAIYVLTRNEVVTSGPATDLHEWLDAEHTDTWRKDIAGSYLAATYALLKQEALAGPLIRAYAFGGGDETYSDFDTRLARDAQHVYLVGRHFPDQLATLDGLRLRELIEPVMANRFNTLSSAFTVLALGEVTRAAAASGDLPALSLAWADEVASAAVFARAEVPVDVSTLSVRGGDGEVYFAASQRGYDVEPPSGAQAEGLELIRDYLDAEGQPVTAATLGEELTVRLRVRALGAPRDNVAITDLLPGGFEVLTDSLSRQFGGWRADYIDVREDRVVVYGRIGTSVTELQYRVKVTSAGEFGSPAAFAASMYDQAVHARTERGRFVVARP